MKVWVVVFCLATVAGAQTADLEGTARGYPALRDPTGKELAEGAFTQWIENERLHVKITYSFNDGRRIEENSVFRQRPQLVQEQWSWREERHGKPYRLFRVEFGSQSAAASKQDDGEFKEWSEKIDVEPGRIFAGFGFTLAIKAFRERLLKGERIELQAVGFTPKPRLVKVELSHAGPNHMRMADRDLRGDHFVIHPKIPWLADLFIDVPDTHIWLTSPAPAAFLRWEGPLAEPKDPIVRVDLLPGGKSGPAEPVESRASTVK
jgi:hypothetical protein